jgi:hypothetical protein
MLEQTEGTIQNGQSRESGNIGYTMRKQSKKRIKKGKRKNTTHMLDTTMRKQTQIK